MIPRRQVCQWLGCAMLAGCAPEALPMEVFSDWPAEDDPGWVEVATIGPVTWHTPPRDRPLRRLLCLSYSKS